VLALVLLSGGIILTLAALVDRPDENHGSADAAAAAAEHETEGQATEGTTGDVVEHADTSVVTNSAESEQGEVGHDQQSNSWMGVDVESLNLASPRLSIVVVGLTVLLAVGLATRRSVGLLVATVGLSLAGVATGAHEATRAGEELGIFVPLPVLASVLYGGASCLAVLALVSAQTDSVAAHSAGAGFATSQAVPPTGHSEGAQYV
jgi:hypothetical protein